eukprot:6606666-Prorocentrum_lima.AAC.1
MSSASEKMITKAIKNTENKWKGRKAYIHDVISSLRILKKKSIDPSYSITLGEVKAILTKL